MHFPTLVDMTEFLIVPSINSQPNQPIMTKQFNQTQTSISVGGFFLIFLLMIYVSLELYPKRQRKKRIVARREQIQTLERIWQISAHQREI